MNSNSTRIVALKLHALHEEDRQWIFSRLESSLQTRLSPLLDELKELGLELNSTDIELIKNNHRELNNNFAEIGQVEDRLIAMIDSVSLSQLEILFDQEPQIFFQCLNSIRTWKWAAGLNKEGSKLLLQNLAAKHKLETKGEPTIAVKRALLRVVAQQLSDIEGLGIVSRHYDDPNYPPHHEQSFIKKLLFKALPWAR